MIYLEKYIKHIKLRIQNVITRIKIQYHIKYKIIHIKFIMRSNIERNIKKALHQKLRKIP